MFFDQAIAGDPRRLLDRRGFTLDVSQHRFNLRQLFTNLFFNVPYKSVSLTQRHLLGDFDVLLLSHDHYDHLCRESIRELAKRSMQLMAEQVMPRVNAAIAKSSPARAAAR